jgi:inosine-uridine nucleoside N-ribohydrolase
LAFPELFQLRAVVCTYNPPEVFRTRPGGSGARHRLTRASIARKLLALKGGEAINIPVGVTRQAPLASKLPDVYWGGWEGSGILDGSEHFADLNAVPDGVELMLETIRFSEDPIVILAIAPMTTLALAWQQDPQLIRDKVLGIAAMSGSLRRREHNIRCDHRAAEIVYGSDIPLAITTADLTEKFRWTARDRNRLSATTPFGQAVLGQVDEYCRLQNRDWTLLHDPLAVLAPFADEARFWDATLSPVAGGRMIKFASPSPRPVQACLEADLPRLKDRLCIALNKVL